jgi:hypothetical protein
MKEARAPLAALTAVSVALLAVRLYAAIKIGFGDSEALYACYAMHPQPAYLDHPGLIGLFSGALASRGAPTPHAAHFATAVLATAIPWLGAAAARAGGATVRGAALSGLALALTPEIAVGLFGMTPDLLLALAWLASLACAAAGLRAPAASLRASLFLVLAGLAAGVGAAAKVSGLLLVAALGATYLTRRAAPHARTLAPWAGIAAGLVVLVPVAAYEAKTGWPMLHHRLVDTQAGAGPSLRNVGAFLGGQLVYLSPPIAIAAALLVRDLWRRRRDDDPVSALYWLAFLVPFAGLLPLCLLSRVAEPHWMAPALLPLALHFGREPDAISRRLAVWSAGVAAALVVAVHAWVLVPALPRAVTPDSADPRWDIANELYGWPEVTERVRAVAASEITPDDLEERRHDQLVVVGPHWVICGQLHAALGRALPVGCDTPIADDFDDWYPRSFWRRAPTIVFVTDNRFPADVAKLFPHRVVARRDEVELTRGGRVVRRFVITVLRTVASG